MPDQQEPEESTIEGECAVDGQEDEECFNGMPEGNDAEEIGKDLELPEDLHLDDGEAPLDSEMDLGEAEGDDEEHQQEDEDHQSCDGEELPGVPDDQDNREGFEDTEIPQLEEDEEGVKAGGGEEAPQEEDMEGEEEATQVPPESSKDVSTDADAHGVPHGDEQPGNSTLNEEDQAVDPVSGGSGSLCDQQQSQQEEDAQGTAMEGAEDDGQRKDQRADSTKESSVKSLADLQKHWEKRRAEWAERAGEDSRPQKGESQEDVIDEHRLVQHVAEDESADGVAMGDAAMEEDAMAQQEEPEAAPASTETPEGEDDEAGDTPKAENEPESLEENDSKMSAARASERPMRPIKKEDDDEVLDAARDEEHEKEEEGQADEGEEAKVELGASYVGAVQKNEEVEADVCEDDTTSDVQMEDVETIEMETSEAMGVGIEVESSAMELCEQLRLVLEPTVCSRLAGDYRTGKRLR